jgi:hypothetical protein
MKENKTPSQSFRPVKFADGSTMEDRVAKVLSEILSDKYDCKVTMRFVDAPRELTTNETNSDNKHK